jgi:hypothetical protein
MTAEVRSVLFVAAILFGTVSGQIPQSAPTQHVVEHSVKAEVVDSKSQPLRFAFLEMRSQEQGETGVRAAADPGGKVVIPSVQPGRYELSIGAQGLITLSRAMEIDGDEDLGRIVLDADPNVLPASASMIAFGPVESDAPVPSIKSITPLRVFRGSIDSSVVVGKRLRIQVSCSVRLPGMNQRPQRDVALAPVDTSGSFEIPVPRCFGMELAHRELRFSLKDEHDRIIAFLLPLMTPQGYYQSRSGIWLPLKPMMEQSPFNVATFYPEYTDNRSLQATLSIRPDVDRYRAGETIFMNYTLTNTSDEVLLVRYSAWSSDLTWTILDEHGERVPFRLLFDRSGEPFGGGEATRSEVIFPSQSVGGGVNISFLFDLASPGTYRVVARRIVRRPELPGEEQITSSESTFVIVARTPPNLRSVPPNDRYRWWRRRGR